MKRSLTSFSRSFVAACLAASLAMSLAMSLVGAPAFASSPKPDADSEEKKSDEPGPGDEGYVPPNSSNMPMLLVPVVLKGRMSHYIFISYRLVMHNELQVDTVNQKIAWVHDAIMRKLYKTDVADPDNPDRPNIPKLEELLKSVANGVLHDDLVESVYFVNFMSENETPQAQPRGRASKKKASSGGH